MTQLSPIQKIIVAAIGERDRWRLIRKPYGSPVLESPGGKRISVRWKTVKSLIRKHVVVSNKTRHSQLGKVIEYHLKGQNLEN